MAAREAVRAQHYISRPQSVDKVAKGKRSGSLGTWGWIYTDNPAPQVDGSSGLDLRHGLQTAQQFTGGHSGARVCQKQGLQIRR